MRTEKTQEEKLLYQYTSPPPIIQWIEERMEGGGKLGINIGLQEGLILKSLCTPKRVEKVVEIGSLYGCSATWMALGLASHGHIYALEKDPQCIKECQQTFEHPEFKATRCQVTLIQGAAQENLPGLESQGPFDLVFIDGDKGGYLEYLHWAKKNLNSQGIIVIDNIHLFGSMFHETCPEEISPKTWRIMKEVLREQLQDPDYNTSLIPTQEGLLISHRKL